MYQLYKSLSETVPYASGSPEPLTLCPCPPETSEHIPNTDKAEVDGGILLCPDCGTDITFDIYAASAGQCIDCFDHDFVSKPACSQCGQDWVLGDFVCKRCGHESDMPF